jgi:hypothetical protein
LYTLLWTSIYLFLENLENWKIETCGITLFEYQRNVPIPIGTDIPQIHIWHIWHICPIFWIVNLLDAQCFNVFEMPMPSIEAVRLIKKKLYKLDATLFLKRSRSAPISAPKFRVFLLHKHPTVFFISLKIEIKSLGIN